LAQSFHSFSCKILIDPNSIFDFEGPSWNGKREPEAKTFHIFYSVRTDNLNMMSIVAATAKTPLLSLFFKYGGHQTIQDKKCCAGNRYL
jgi:hypothetical protein